MFLFLIGGVVFASDAKAIDIGDNLEALPAVNQGVAFSLEDSKFNYLTTIDIVKCKNATIELGAAYDAEETGVKAVAVFSYDFGKLEDLGVKVPVLKELGFKPGIYGGYGRIEGCHDGSCDAEFDWGVTATVLSLKF